MKLSGSKPGGLVQWGLVDRLPGGRREEGGGPPLLSSDPGLHVKNTINITAELSINKLPGGKARVRDSPGRLRGLYQGHAGGKQQVITILDDDCTTFMYRVQTLKIQVCEL